VLFVKLRMAIYIKSFFQMFSVAGLDVISRALGWAIVGALVLGMLAAALSAAAISTFADEYFCIWSSMLRSRLALLLP
jgi:hypothetical protein